MLNLQMGRSSPILRHSALPLGFLWLYLFRKIHSKCANKIGTFWFFALIHENFAPAQKYFTQVSLVRLVKNFMFAFQSVHCCWDFVDVTLAVEDHADDFCFCRWINLMSILKLSISCWSNVQDLLCLWNFLLLDLTSYLLSF